MSGFPDVKDDKTLNEWLHEIAFVTSTMSDPDEPQSFQEAWWDPDLISREKWREAIRLEFKKMLDMGVWRDVKRNDRPNDCRLVGCRWVFKVKRNGVYHARLVAKGFSQIPGVDFTDNYSPVVNDVTFRVVVVRMIIENMKGKVVDIGPLPELCIFFAFFCITFHLHYICILHSPRNRYICITFD